MIRTGGLLVALAVAAIGSAVAAPSRTETPSRAAGVGIRADSEIASNDTPPARRHVPSRHIASRLGLSVDLVRLKSGTTLRGAIARYEADGSLTMAVSREWLRKASPELFARRTRAEVSVRRAALEQLRDRLNQESVGVPEDSRLAAFLRSERKRVERLLAEAAPPDQPQFVWLDLAKKEIAKIKPAAAGNRRIAAWSWYERLANVETRDADDLARQLRRKGIDPAQPLPDLSDRFPLRMQDDREWRARMALVVYALDKPLDFQGTGDQLVPADRSANAKDAGPLIAKLLGGQVDALASRICSAKAGRPQRKPDRPTPGSRRPIARPSGRRHAPFVRRASTSIWAAARPRCIRCLRFTLTRATGRSSGPTTRLKMGPKNARRWKPRSRTTRR